MRRMILTRLRGPVEHLGIVDQVEIAVAQAEFHVLHAAPLVGVRLQRFAQDTSACRQRSSARPCASCRKSPSTPMRSPRSRFLRDAPALFADLLLADHHLHPAGPVPDIEEVAFALAAPLDDSPGRLDARSLVLRSGRQAMRAWRRSTDGRRSVGPTGPAPSPSMRAQFIGAAGLKRSGASATEVGFRFWRNQRTASRWSSYGF